MTTEQQKKSIKKDSFIQWWHKLPKNTKIIYAVIALAVVGAGIFGVQAYSNQLAAERYRIVNGLLTQYGYTSSNSSLCEEGNDVIYKDENGEEQKIYGGITGSIFDDTDAIRKKLRDAKYTDLCDSLNDEYIRAVNQYDIDKVKEILAKVSAAKKEALKRKNAEVEIARGQKAEDDKERQSRTNTFTVTTRNGYNYRVTYELAKEPAVYASIDTSEGRPGYGQVSINMHTTSWSVTNTTNGKKAPCLRGLVLQPLYSAALRDTLKEADADNKAANASLSGVTYTTINDADGFRGIEFSAKNTYYDNCIMAPDETVKSESSSTSESGTLMMKEDVAKKLIELVKQPTGYVVSVYDDTKLDSTTPIYGEVYDRAIVHVAKGFSHQ